MTIRLPKLSLTMENGRLVRWLAPLGQPIAKDAVIAEIESDKAVVELTMPKDGIIEELCVNEGDVVDVGAPIAHLRSGEEAPAPRHASSPAARRRARELKIEIARVTGSGPGGRVVCQDVEQEAANAQEPPNTSSPSLPLMRRAIARIMTESVTTIPQFPLTFAVELGEILRIKENLHRSMARRQIKLSLTDFVIRAVAESLVEYPELNASFIGNPSDDDCRIVRHQKIHAGLAVGVEDGIFVPVIPDADQLPVAEIAARRMALIESVRAGNYERNPDTAATFTLSNLGATGVEQFQAIINPPESFILAMGAAREQAVVQEGKLVIRPVMRLTGTFDHRVVDGARAGEFLKSVVQRLEKGDWLLV